MLPQGGRLLEAGCGGGWQSLALAQTGKFQMTVMDFSRNALDHAQGVFAKAGEQAEFRLQDVFAPAEPEFDLVFNAGVLEHYTFEEQTSFVKAMAARSKRFVLVLVPNASCYWYWLWRIHHAARGGWPFGKEAPIHDLAPVMQAAGLHFAGQIYLGADWTASFLDSLQGLDDGLRQEFLAIHRAGLIPAAQQSYLLAALATIDAEPPLWPVDESNGRPVDADLRASLADALALRIGGEANIVQLRGRLANETAQLRLQREEETGQLQIRLNQAAEAAKLTSDKLRTASESLKSKQQEVGNLHQQLEDAAGTASAFQAQVGRGVRDYASIHESTLEELRHQRAWMIMLAVRKAYMLATRPGLSAKLSFLWWLLKLPLAGAGTMEKCDVVLPNVLNYVPAPPEQPIARSRKAPFYPPGFVPQTKYDVVVLPIIDFDFRFQRPQQIAAQFARNGHRVIWVSPTRFLPMSSAEPYQVHVLREGLWEIRLRGPQPDIYLGTLSDENAQIYAESLAAVYRDFGIAENCVLVQLSFWRKVSLILRREQSAKLLYDCMDDWETFQNIGQFILTEERQFVHECDVLVVTAAQLEQNFTKKGLAPILVRNGSDFNFFNNAVSNSLLDGISRPLVGYFGAIADWIDLDLVLQTAKLRPQYSFVLIGQVFDRDVSGLQALPNVHLLGSKPYEQIPLYLYGFDVCTIPFLLNQVTQATDPVKLYEYFSQGKPVVATRMAELNQCAGLLYFGDTPEEFAVQLDAAVEEKDSSLRERRKEFAEANTWAKRVDVMDEHLRSCYPLVSVILISFNSAEFLEVCLDSIEQGTSYPNYEVIAVDNHSTDGSPALLRRFAAANPRLRPLLLDKNYGFAGANNAAAREAKGEYLVLLNADTMVTSGWLERLMHPAVLDQSVGIVSAVTNFAGNEVKINFDYEDAKSMDAFALWRAQNHRHETLQIPMAPLFCSLIPRKVWDAVGGLDEIFDVGMFEDDDFAERVLKSGYRVVAAEDCFVHHFGQGSFGKLTSDEYNAIFVKNQARFESKAGRAWYGHQTRAGVRPVAQDRRFAPADFRTARRRE